MIKKLVSRVRGNWPAVFFFLLLLANVWLWSVVYRAGGSVLTIAFLNVGQGDGIFIEAPGGNQVLVDAGPGRSVLRELGRVMPFYDRSIDLLVVTHPDADHIGGFPEVLKRFAVAAVMESGIRSETAVYRAFTEAAAAEGSQKIFAQRGMKILLGRGAVLEILFPDRPPAADWESNTASIVAQLVVGEQKFLLTADAPVKIEKYLVALDGRKLRSEVLKVGHHGSETASDPLFLAAARPRYAVLSVGKNNRYGHPRPAVLKSLAAADASVLRTDERGTIIFKTDGETLSVLN